MKFCLIKHRGGTTHPPSGIMTRRSCAIYATGIVCAHLLIVGIALVVAQVFQTMIHSRLKKVSWADLHVLSQNLSSFSPLSYFVTHLSHSRVVFKRVICSGQSSACSIVSPVVPAEGHRIVCFKMSYSDPFVSCLCCYFCPAFLQTSSSSSRAFQPFHESA